MKAATGLATLLAGTTFTAAQASANDHGAACTARVLHSEELPFAPFPSWLLRVTLEVTAPDGRAYQLSSQDNLPWQAPPPRRGQTFRLLCDPADPTNLHFAR